jgi:hypothetical protein
MQLPAQFVEADVMSVGKLDYVAGLELCSTVSPLFLYKYVARGYEI